MPVQTVEELRALKAQIHKLYGVYGERIIAAEVVQMYRIKHTARPAIRSSGGSSGSSSPGLASSTDSNSSTDGSTDADGYSTLDRNSSGGGGSGSGGNSNASPAISRKSSSSSLSGSGGAEGSVKKSRRLSKLIGVGGSSKPSDRLMVVGKHRIYIFQCSSSILGSSLPVVCTSRFTARHCQTTPTQILSLSLVYVCAM
jgi:hypothetical protein